MKRINKAESTLACCPICYTPVFDNGIKVMDYCLECDSELDYVQHVNVEEDKMILTEKLQPLK
jgi:uncharacterized protein (DUF983 family)